MSTRVEANAPVRAAPPDPAAPEVPNAVAPPPGAPRFPLVDGVRAIAALFIVVTHTAGLTGFNAANPLGAWTARMDSGVAIFFVLSGFLLYRPWVAARHAGRPGPRPAAYARRRALRILPAYWVALTVLGIVFAVEVPGAFGQDWWIYYGLLQSWQSATIIGGIGVAWSLSVEAAFYVGLPLVALATARGLRDRPVRTQTTVELIALCLSAAVAFGVRTLVRAGDHDSTFGNTLPGMWGWFAAGMALAVLSAAYAGRPLRTRPALLRSATERPALWWLAAFAALTVAALAVGLPRSFIEPYTTTTLALEHLLYGTMAVCLVVPAIFADSRRSLVSAVLGNPVVAWLGLISYGIFLYHLPLARRLQPVVDWLPAGGFAVYTAVAIAAAAACAAASYYAVERPLLRLKGAR